MRSVLKILLFFSIIFVILALLILRPVPIVPEHRCLEQEGTISYLFEGGINDVNFRIKENDVTYYINRGLENGLNMNDLKSQLMDKKVLIKYPKYWTLLDPRNKFRHVSKLYHDGNVVFSEIGD